MEKIIFENVNVLYIILELVEATLVSTKVI